MRTLFRFGGMACVSRILPALALAAVCAVAASTSVQAQVLDDEVERLLSNQCAGLQLERGNVLETGPNLTRICNFPPGVGSSSGGGAASPQGSTLSLQNILVEQRLERARKKGKHEPSTSAYLPFRATLLNASLVDFAETDDPAGSGSPAAPRRFDVFASGTYESLDRNTTPFEDGYDSSVKAGSVGADYRFSDTLVAGLLLGYRKQDGDFLGGGRLEMTTFEPTLYASILPSPETFLDVVASFGSEDSDTERNVFFEIVGTDPPATASGLAASSPGSTVYSGGAQFGYDKPLKAFTIGPRIAVSYRHTTIDGYAETGGTGLELRVDERSVESLQGVLGFYGSVALSSKSAVFLPQLGLQYVHEFEDEASIVTAELAEDLRGPTALPFTYQTSVPDADFFHVDAGFAAVLANGIQPYLNIRVMFGNDNFDSVGGTIGVRFEL